MNEERHVGWIIEGGTLLASVVRYELVLVGSGSGSLARWLNGLVG